MKKKMTTQELILTGMLAAVAGVLMSLEFSVPMMPPFYKVDFSDVPSVIAIFLMGPVSGALVELVKIMIKLITVGTNTMYVGELANLIGILLFVAPIWMIYRKRGQNTRAAMEALAVSLPIRIAVSCAINACITLPLYARAMGLSLNEVVQTVGAVNPLIKNLPLFLILATVPFNLLKLLLNYTAGWLLFEKLRKVSILRTRTV